MWGVWQVLYESIYLTGVFESACDSEQLPVCSVIKFIALVDGILDKTGCVDHCIANHKPAKRIKDHVCVIYVVFPSLCDLEIFPSFTEDMLQCVWLPDPLAYILYTHSSLQCVWLPDPLAYILYTHSSLAKMLYSFTWIIKFFFNYTSI